MPCFRLKESTPGRPVVVVVYYLVWKHIVGFLNDVVGIE